jgi:RHS repeat-associated protein
VRLAPSLTSFLHGRHDFNEQLGPATISSYRSPYSATWDPTARNRLDGDWVTGRRVSPWASLPALAGPRATTGLSGQALSIDGTPLANVTLSIQNTSKQTRTDGTGRFLLKRLSPGHQILDIDGGTADGHSKRYGQFSVAVELAKGKTTALGYTIWMTPLDPSGDKTIASPTKRETVVTNPKIPGLEVRLPAGTIIREANGKVVHKLNLTAIPVDRPPFPLPLFVPVPTYFTVQPGRAYLNKGAQIIYPNWGHLHPGQRVDFWNYDPADKGWYVYGKGSVSSDGKQVVPDPDVRVWEFTGAMVPITGEPPGSGPGPGGPGGGPGPGGGDPVDLATGLFVYKHTDLELSDSVMPVDFTRTYRPGDYNSYAFGVGTTDPFELRLWSDENYKNAYLVLPNGSKVKLHRTSAGTGFIEAVYEAVETPGEWQGAVMHYTLGTGWTLRRRDGTKFIFGDLAPLKAIEDRNGNRITLVRENESDEGGVGALGPIVQIRASHGRTIDLSYDGENRIIRATDNAGQTVKYRYDSSGRLVEVTDPEGDSTRYAYNSENAMTTVTDARGNVLISNTYEGEKVKTQTMGGLGTYRFSYFYPESPSKVAHTRMVDPDGHEHVLYWNTSTGLPLSERIGSEQTSYQRNTEGNITHVVASSGDASYTYDAVGDITSIKREAPGLGPLTADVAYNEFSEPTEVTDPEGRTTSYIYDAHGNRAGTANPSGDETTMGYDSEGELTSLKDPQGNTTVYSYEGGNQVSVTNPLGRKTKMVYDAVGRPIGIIDAEGRTTHFGYDDDNELVSETDPAGDITSYSYDTVGDLLSATDPEGHTQTGTYNSLDELTSWTNAIGKTTSYEYDGDRNRKSVTDPKGRKTIYAYDDLNRISAVSFGSVEGGSPSSTIDYGYDAAGDLTSIADSRGGAYTRGYDAYHRLTSEAGPNGSVGYSYDADGERIRMTMGGGEAASYTYNLNRQLTGVDTPNGAVSFAYNEDGQRTKVQLPDGDTENYAYDSAGELAGIAYKNPAGEALGNIEYARDALGRVSTVSGSYARTNLPEALSEASYNAGNELTSLDGHTYSYDADGDLTSNGTSSFEWNDRNQLTDVTQGSEKWSFAYDLFGRRTSKTANGATTSYLNDGGNVLAETLEGKTSTLLDGLGLDARYARTTSGGTDSYLTEQMGSTIGLANTSGELVTEYTYDPFGATTSTGISSENPYQYTGRENDRDNLQSNRARYYDPSVGTFISPDPLGTAGNEVNLYRYAGDDPLNVTDPSGTTENPLHTAPGGEGERIKEIENEEAGLPPQHGGPGGPANLGAPKNSGGWKKVGCEAATVIPGKAGLAVAGACGIEVQPIGHIPSIPEGVKLVEEGIEEIGALL